MKKLYISQQVHRRLENNRMFKVGSPEYYKYFHMPKMSVLGMNDAGVIVDFVDLPRLTQGCKYMPHIPAQYLTKAYIKLAKKNLKPCGLLKRYSNLNGKDFGETMTAPRRGLYGRGYFGSIMIIQSRYEQVAYKLEKKYLNAKELYIEVKIETNKNSKERNSKTRKGTATIK